LKVSYTESGEEKQLLIDEVLLNGPELVLKLKFPEGEQPEIFPATTIKVDKVNDQVEPFLYFHSSETAYEWKEPFTFETEEFFVEQKGVEFISTPVKAASGVTQAVNLAIVALNLPLAIAVMKLFQNIDYLNMLSLKYSPQNFIAFVEFFSGGLLEFIPNPFDGTEYEDYNCPASKDWIFFQEEGTCGFFKESGVQLTIFSILLLMKALCMALQSPSKKSSKKNQIVDSEIGKVKDYSDPNESQQDLKIEHAKNAPKKSNESNKSFVDKVSDYLSPTFFIFLSRAMIYDLFLPSMVNLRFGSPTTPIVSVISWIVSIGTIFINILLMAKVLNLLFKIEKSREDKIESTHLKSIYKNWLDLRENLREGINKMRRFTPEIMTITDILTCFVLVLFYKNGIA
jgi:hypothetical protein